MRSTLKLFSHAIMMIMMIMMIMSIIVITHHNMGITMMNASWDEAESLQVYYERKEAISGQDENEKNEVLLLEKFRVLLGLKTLTNKRKQRENELRAPSPSPISIEAQALGPSPGLSPAQSPFNHAHLHHHHDHHHHHHDRRLPRPRPMLKIHKFDNQHKKFEKRKIILIAVIASSGAILLILSLGALLWIIWKMYHKKKVIIRTVSVCSDQGGNRDRSKGVKTQNLASKVTNELNSDLFYIDTLTTVLEPQTCVKKEVNGSLEKSEMENVGSSSHERNNLDDKGMVEEIISVHEYAESSKNESDDQKSMNGDKMDEIDRNSSEDESFHSFCDSRSSSNCNHRLSNVSVGSFCDTFEVFSPKNSLLSNPLPIPSSNQGQNLQDSTQPPPPPPPLPPPPSPPPPPPPPPKMVQTSPSEPKTKPEESLVSPPETPNILEGPKNIPLPPCPPPFLNGKASSSKGPPPPPGPPPPFMPLGKDGSPLPKLKPLHWDKVRAQPDRSMVWDKIRCNSFELDEEMIESLFGYNLQTAFKNDEGKSKSPSPNKHVLEPKRLQNITILSKALNATTEKVCEALLQGEGLSVQQLEALVKMAPTVEEEAKLYNYKGDTNELGSAENLVKKVLTVPHAFQRIEAMLYKATFDDEVIHLRNSFQMLEEACKELRSSRLFLKLLEAVLKTGNRMNVGTIRGGARAFKLDALLKLADVKGTDGKTTLLHFVVQEMIRSEGIRMSDSIMGKIGRNSKVRTTEEKEDNYRKMGLELVSGLSTELCNVKRTASIDLDVLATSVSNLSDGMSKLQQLVNKIQQQNSRNNFLNVMKSFLKQAENNLKELEAEENKVLLSVREITEYYHGDVSKDEANPLRIFVIVRDFLGMLDQVCRELKSLKIPKSPNPLSPFQ